VIFYRPKFFLPVIVMATEPNNNRSDTPNGHENGDASPQTVTLRMLMQGKEAGSIIGKKGENVKKFREESGAKINISDSSCPERIVTVTGFIEQIQAAFGMICKKFEDDMITLQQLQAQLQGQPTNNLPRPIVAIRLIIPASQCGSLIGKGGAKIKEIRDVTGASIQVASDMLPNSTERAVTVTGSAHAIALAIFHVCTVLMESPPKGATIPYRPKPAVPPVIYTPSGQAIAVQPGQFMSQAEQMKALGFQGGAIPPGMFVQIAPQGMFPGGQNGPAMQGGMPAQQMGGRPNMMPANQVPNGAQTQEMTIPNDLIGCIIGRGGSKINEIRQMSGAMIKISNVEENSGERKVTITGTPETINTAQYLINCRMWTVFM
jgi:poly(rC)-binding protein 2/3/4